MEITPADELDIDAIRALLISNGLPTDGFPEECAVILALKDRGRVVGGSALEQHANYGLLRSVVVAARARGTGQGERLVAAALAQAAAMGLYRVFLLSETAAGFFPRFGFQPVLRRQVPPEVQASVEFHSACPESAQAMALDLAGGLPGSR